MGFSTKLLNYEKNQSKLKKLEEDEQSYDKLKDKLDMFMIYIPVAYLGYVHLKDCQERRLERRKLVVKV
jgi:hypothetical protein